MQNKMSRWSLLRDDGVDVFYCAAFSRLTNFEAKEALIVGWIFEFGLSLALLKPRCAKKMANKINGSLPGQLRPVLREPANGGEL